MLSATPNKGREKTKSVPKPKTKNLSLVMIPLALLIIVGIAVMTSGDSTPKKKSSPAVSACGAYRTDRVVQINGQAFNTEVASSSSEFDKGLGGRPCILPNQAMLFAFKQPGQYPFWMKGMKFPIDIIWISASHTVVAEEVDEQPSTYPDKFVNQKSRPAQYVLEVKANRTKELNINPGTSVSF